MQPRLLRILFRWHILSAEIYWNPNGKDYYWLGNTIEKQDDKNTDYYVLMEENNISVTPLSIHGHTVTDYEPTKRFFAEITKNILENEDGII